MTSPDEHNVKSAEADAALAEADAYDEAADEAAAEGRHDSAEMFRGLAADKRIEAERG